MLVIYVHACAREVAHAVAGRRLADLQSLAHTVQVNRFKIVDYQSHYHYHSQAHAFDHGRADDVTTTRLSRRRIDRREGRFVPTVMKGKTEKLKNLGQKVDLYLHL